MLSNTALVTAVNFKVSCAYAFSFVQSDIKPFSVKYAVLYLFK